MASKQNKVFVAVPCTEFINTETVSAFLGMAGVSKWWISRKHYSVVGKRNAAVEYFLDETDCTHLMFLDSDMVPASGTVPRLLLAEKPIIAGVALMASKGHKPAVFASKSEVFWDYDGEIHEVAFVGMANTLIRRDVLESLEKPWFQELHESGCGEDRFFCEQAVKAGFKVYCDTGFITPHIISYAMENETFQDVMKTHAAEVADARNSEQVKQGGSTRRVTDRPLAHMAKCNPAVSDRS